jgi:integrase
MGSIRVRTGRYGTRYAALWRDADGTQHSQTFDTRQAAKNALKPNGGAASIASKPVIEAKPGTVADFAGTWIETHPLKPATRQTYMMALNAHILPAIGGRRLTSVTHADIYAVVNRWRSAGMSAALQAKLRTVMISMFEDATQRAIIPTNPARGIKISKQVITEMRVLTVAEYQRALECLPAQYRLLVRTAVASGARWGELAELRGTDIMGDTIVLSRNVAELKAPHRFIVQTTLKNGKGRKVKISHALAEELHALGAGLLFPPARGSHLSRNAFGRIWRMAQDRAGITPPCRVHDLRHTAISWWLADGMPLATVRDRAGHWNIAVTSRYIHATTDAEDDALSRSAA